MLDIDICHAAIEAKTAGSTAGSMSASNPRASTAAASVRRARRNGKTAVSTFRPRPRRPRVSPVSHLPPELAPGHAPIDAQARLAAQAYARIEAGALEERGLETLAGELGVTDRHLRRVMNAQFGASPIDIAQTARLLTAKRLLAETNLSVTSIAFASGFRSLRRFNATCEGPLRALPIKLARAACAS